MPVSSQPGSPAPAALDHIERKRRTDGRWLLDHSLNGTMLADIELTGRPSKRVTLRALLVLQHHGRIDQAL